MELEDKVQRKDPDINQKMEEEITGEGFDQRVGRNVNKITSGDVPKNEQDNPGEKTPIKSSHLGFERVCGHH